MNLETPPWIADFRFSAALDVFFLDVFLDCKGGGVPLLDVFRFPSFGLGFLLLGVFLVCLLVFLWLDWGGFCVFCSAYPPRPVSGLVWVIGPLTCGTGRVYRVVVWVYVVFGVFRFFFLLVFDIHCCG